MVVPREVREIGRNATSGIPAAIGRARHPNCFLLPTIPGLLEHPARFSRAHRTRPTPSGQFFSVGRNSQRHSAGRNTIAASMLTTNMKVSITPMSAWNFSSENTQVPTPTASVSAV
jgi:hypothetical protein